MQIKDLAIGDGFVYLMEGVELTGVWNKAASRVDF